MSLAQGRHYLAIPGPSVVPDRVLNAMHQPAPNIYEGALIDMVAGLIPDLKAVARTKHSAAIYIANGHGTWEAAISNTLAAGDKVLVVASSHFALGWAGLAEKLGIKVDVIDFGKQPNFDLDCIETALRADLNHEIKAVLTTHVDTSTSYKTDIAALRGVIDAADHPALFMVDCIASLGCDRFEMDVWGVDLMITACQKGLMTPPGMGFVFFNEKAAKARKTLDRVSPYWDWSDRIEPEIFSNYFFGTAPTHHLLGLREALNMINEEGLEQVWDRHKRLSVAVHAAVDAWGQGDGAMRLNIADPAERSSAVTSVRIGAPDGTRLRKWVTDNAGITLGIGLGMAASNDPAWHGFFRIGHMGHVNAQMVLGVLGSIDTALKALDIPHGPNAMAKATQSLSLGAFTSG
ncbi:MAG: aminotransferase class V-fold PLP-dependent enzyme [Paracoccaceae bacterium]|nr:aminotransferase class V-fold PLP-dependent enzyme [Paracoccaceae bacterium]